MFETSFSYSSAVPLPPQVPLETALETLHEFETVIKLSPDCRGCKEIPPPPKNGYANGTSATVRFYEVEDELPFIPKKLWAGGVRYTADFVPVADGCDITVHAPGGFTSTNRWRVCRNINMQDHDTALERSESKDASYVDNTGQGWFVQIVSDARCSRTFAGFVKGFLKNSHGQLQQAFNSTVKSRVQPKEGRPKMGRRNSSVL